MIKHEIISEAMAVQLTIERTILLARFAPSLQITDAQEGMAPWAIIAIRHALNLGVIEGTLRSGVITCHWQRVGVLPETEPARNTVKTGNY